MPNTLYHTFSNLSDVAREVAENINNLFEQDYKAERLPPDSVLTELIKQTLLKHSESATDR